MTVRIGLIGAGVMGADHARTIVRKVTGAELTALYDTDRDRLAALSEEIGSRHVSGSVEEVIESGDVDAVLVASPDATHANLVLKCLEVGKPVLCEKPLAPTSAECLRIVEAESRLGRRLVQVGFMRRFDPAYLVMKKAFAAGELGRPRYFHSVHRNVAAPSWFTSDMVINNTAVHDIDIARWLLGEEMARATVFAGPSQSGSLRDPQFIVLTGRNGTLVTVEAFVNAGYGYDIRGELVCEHGTISLAPPVHVQLRHKGREAFGFAPDWRPRFAESYWVELQSWVDAIRLGSSSGASAWDGYVASAVAEACLASLSDNGRSVDIALPERPAFYDEASG